MQLNFVRLALTQSGFLLGLSPALVGFWLGRLLGPGSALASILLASLVVVAMGLLSARLAVAYREPTATLAQHFLGGVGGRLVGLALATSFVGWLRIHALAITAAAQPPDLGIEAVGDGPLATALLFLCAVASVLLVRRDNVWIARLSAVQGPALMVLFASSLLQFGSLASTRLQLGRPNAASVLLIVAAGLSDVIDMPTLLHRARSVQAAMGSVAVTYGLVLPGMLVFGVLLSCSPQADNLVAALAQGGPGFALAVKILVVGSATVANAGLLWSGSTSLATAFATQKTQALRWGMACLGLILSLATVKASVDAVLAVLGTVTGGVGSVMLTGFVLDKGRPERGRPRPEQRAHVRAASLAVSVGLCALAAAHASGTDAACGIWVAALCGVTSTLALRRPRAAT